MHSCHRTLIGSHSIGSGPDRRVCFDDVRPWKTAGTKGPVFRRILNTLAWTALPQVINIDHCFGMVTHVGRGIGLRVCNCHERPGPEGRVQARSNFWGSLEMTTQCLQAAQRHSAYLAPSARAELSGACRKGVQQPTNMQPGTFYYRWLGSG